MTYTEPLLSLVLLLLAVAWIRGRGDRGRFWILSALILLFLISWPPFDWLFSRPLEAPFTPSRPDRDGAEAIVVLSSAVEQARFYRPYPIPDRQTYLRTLFASWLYMQGKPIPVLACGGTNDPEEPAYAGVMADILEHQGVPRNMIWTEQNSRSTHENAVFGAKMLRPRGIHRIALVTEAQSMLRAQACFRKEGFEVVAVPSDYRDLGPLRDEVLPSWKSIQRNEITLHEFGGLAWYRIHGWL